MSDSISTKVDRPRRGLQTGITGRAIARKVSQRMPPAHSTRYRVEFVHQ
ncbi:hypothetical protein QUA70_14205 [Microcoleus sp. LAD1_D5]